MKPRREPSSPARTAVRSWISAALGLCCLPRHGRAGRIRPGRGALALSALGVALWCSTARAAPPTEVVDPAPGPASSAGRSSAASNSTSAADPSAEGAGVHSAEGTGVHSAEGDAPSDDERAVVEGFEPALSPYGAWRDHAVYGRVWVPHTTVVGPGFEPYVTAGHWAVTNDGEWIWVSDYPFGEIVYHYGRWVWASDSGWLWIPGWRYAPAWVVWRVPHGRYAYVGWAPMPPSYIWVGTELVWLDVAPPAAFVFCHSSYVFRPHPHRHIVRDRIALRRMLRDTTHYYPERHGAGLRRSPSPSRALVPAWAVPRQRVAARPTASGPVRVAKRATPVSVPPAARASARARPRPTAESPRGIVESRREALRERRPPRPSAVAPLPRSRANPTSDRTAPQRRAAHPRAVRRSR